MPDNTTKKESTSLFCTPSPFTLLAPLSAYVPIISTLGRAVSWTMRSIGFTHLISQLVRHASMHRRLCVLLAVVLALFSLTRPGVDAQLSANNAATFVLLRGIDTDENLRRVFYDAPANTSMTIPVDGYEVLSESRNSAPLQSAYSASLFYRGHRGTAPRPYRVRLSDKWVLLEKSLAGAAATVVYTEQDDEILQQGAAKDAALLHCRLPLPRSAQERQDVEAAFLRQEGPHMRAALEEWWWHLGTPERGERCLYGDGESGTTGVSRYYALCPTGRTTRVRHYELKKILASQATTVHQSSGAEAGAKKSKKDEEVVDFLRRKDHEHVLGDMADDAVFAAAFEVIGEYHPTLSRPRWNPEHAAWEILYPSTSPCATHMSSEATSADAGDAAYTRFYPASWRATPTAVGSSDAFWKTVVRFRCTDDGVASRNWFGAVGYWAITDLRQTCTYQMEIATPVVCGWEQELDRLHINAIPCAVLSDAGAV